VAGTRAAGAVALAVAAAVGLAACSGSGTTAGPGTSPTAASTGSAAPRPTGTVVRLGPGDDGRTVPLAVGDRLQVILSGGRLNSSWALVSYPRPTLATDPQAPPYGGISLVVQAAGAGRVVLVRVLCGPVVDPPCAGGSGVGPAPTGPTRWAVTVVVR
jgi:hypothetical protein